MDCFNYRIAEEPIFRVSVPTNRGAPCIPRHLTGALPPISIYPIITISESHGNGGKMGRVSYELSEDNRRRLELLTAFGILNGHYPSRDEIVNESIRQYFMRVYEDYCSKADPNDMMKRMMEEVIS